MEIVALCVELSATLDRWHCNASETVYLAVSQFCYILTTGYFFPNKHNAFHIHIHEPGFTPLRKYVSMLSESTILWEKSTVWRFFTRGLLLMSRVT